MIRTCTKAALILCLVPMLSVAGEPADNVRLVEMFKADQAARADMPIDWEKVAPMDKAHHEETTALLRAGSLRTANDYYHAAMILQHGESVDDYQLAYSLSRISATIDPKKKSARWLAAAAWDRILMSKGVPQWYGTQYHQPSPDAPMELYRVDESVISDEERAAMSVPSLQEAKELLLEINK